jgi:hypothetical protein
LRRRQVSGHDLGRAERSLLRVKDVENTQFLVAAGWRAGAGLGPERPKDFFSAASPAGRLKFPLFVLNLQDAQLNVLRLR